MANLVFYPKLSTCSRRAIAKTTSHFGRPYHYRPRGQLLQRLARESGWTLEQVHAQLLRERAELLRETR